jgi:hypothetical protein
MKHDEKKMAAKREVVRKALDDYKTALLRELAGVPRGSGDADNEFDHIKASITQVESAKRVLWMEK